jgi:diamine N-acetyltransferase
MISIKKADLSHAPIIASLGRITFAQTFGDLFTKLELEKYLSETFNLNKISNSLSKQNNLYWIAYFNENAVGYAKIKLNSKIENIDCVDQIQLQKIYVLKEYLDKKIGSALLNEIISIKELTAGSILWLVVLSTNGRAIRFYEKSGFKKLRKHYHQIGKLTFIYELMLKEL